MPTVSVHSTMPIGPVAPVTPRRSARFDDEPGYYEPAGLWLYGNVRLLDRPLGFVVQALGPATQSPADLQQIERIAEEFVLEGNVLVCGVHSPAHQRAAVMPLRWGAPRIVVFSGGFRFHLGKELKDESFLIARLWRYAWDPLTDLAISRRAPDKLPTFARHNPTVDRLIRRIVDHSLPGPLFGLPLIRSAGI